VECCPSQRKILSFHRACCRRLIAPLSGPINDQDLRVVARCFDRSDPPAAPAAATQVAVAVSEMLIRVGQLLQPANNVSAREIPLGVTKILLRQAEVLSGGTEATVVAVAMVAMMAMVVVVAEQSLQSLQSLQETWQHRQETETEHYSFSSLLAVPAPASCRRFRSRACFGADAAKRVHIETAIL
jgi:hypothetical protein